MNQHFPSKCSTNFNQISRKINKRKFTIARLRRSEVKTQMMEIGFSLQWKLTLWYVTYTIFWKCELQWRNRSARGTYKTVHCEAMPRLWVRASPGAILCFHVQDGVNITCACWEIFTSCRVLFMCSHHLVEKCQMT